MTADLFRLAVVVLALAAVALVAALLEPEWARDLGLDEYEVDPFGNRRRAERTPRSMKAISRDAAASPRRTRAVAALFDGRLGLFEAAATFRRLNNEEHPAYPRRPISPATRRRSAPAGR